LPTAKRVEIMKNAMEEREMAEGRKIIRGLSPWARLPVMTSTVIEKKVMGQVVTMLVVLSLDLHVHLSLAITFPPAPSLDTGGVFGSYPSLYTPALPLPPSFTMALLVHATSLMAKRWRSWRMQWRREREMAEGRKLSPMHKS
jgi:hypothetical protein